MLGWLQNWLNCYATDIFPEPDLAKAAIVLTDNPVPRCIKLPSR